MTLFHPRQKTLVAFALGDLEERGRVARHLERCSDCRQLVGFTQRLSTAAASLPAPAASEDLLARALADRAEGQRFIAPDATVQRARFVASPRKAIGTLVAAAAAIIIIVGTIIQLRAPDFHGV